MAHSKGLMGNFNVSVSVNTWAVKEKQQGALNIFEDRENSSHHGACTGKARECYGYYNRETVTLPVGKHCPAAVVAVGGWTQDM